MGLYGYTAPMSMTGYARGTGAAQRPSRLALTAAGTPGADVFGLLTDTTSNARVVRPAVPPAAAPTKPAAPSVPAGFSLQGLAGVPPGVTMPVPGTPAWSALVSQQQTPATKPFDINTDPTYGEALALAGKNDSEATSGALAAKEQTLLGYGDPNLARALLGDDTLAQAAAANPTSTLANLAQQRTKNTHDLTENLNHDNLAFSGYRITQEDQMAHDYQNALAQAAAGVNGALGSIDSQLGGQLDANAQSRIQAALAAYQLHKGDTGGPADTPPPDAAPPNSGVLNLIPQAADTTEDPRALLRRALAGRQPIPT